VCIIYRLLIDILSNVFREHFSFNFVLIGSPYSMYIWFVTVSTVITVTAIVFVTRVHWKLCTSEIRATDSLAKSNCTNRAVFYAEVADVFPVPTSGGLEVVSCVVLVIVIGTTKPFIPEQVVLCILQKNCKLFAETVFPP
jgi:hypothetical protein